MQPEIKQFESTAFVGMRTSMSLVQNKTPELWRGFSGFLIKNNIQAEEKYSVNIYPENYFQAFSPNAVFEKWAGITEVDSKGVSDELETLTIPSGLYAVFHYVGSSADPSIFQYIFNEWLPQSNYQLDHRPHFEVLGSKYKNNDATSEEDIWIPIREKG